MIADQMKKKISDNPQLAKERDGQAMEGAVKNYKVYLRSWFQMWSQSLFQEHSDTLMGQVNEKLADDSDIQDFDGVYEALKNLLDMEVAAVIELDDAPLEVEGPASNAAGSHDVARGRRCAKVF